MSLRRISTVVHASRGTAKDFDDNVHKELSPRAGALKKRPRSTPRRVFAGLSSIVLFTSLFYFVLIILMQGNRESNPVLNSAGSTLMDMSFSMVVNNASVCSQGVSAKGPLLLILVHSAHRHSEYRKRVRETWASIAMSGTWLIRTVFVLGVGNSGKLLRQIESENNRHGDLIIGNFLDSYKNLTIKHLFAYRWTLEYCKQATYILKTDDDMFVDIYGLLGFLKGKYKLNYEMSSSIMCKEGKRRPPRFGVDDGIKWAVSWQEFPDELYPNYCLGAAYITTPKIVSNLFRAHKLGRYLWVDDVFVTGILRKRFNDVLATRKRELITISNIQKHIELDKDEVRWQSDKFFYLLKVHGRMNFKGMQAYWELIHEHYNIQLVTRPV